jgi:hypothetical protein
MKVFPAFAIDVAIRKLARTMLLARIVRAFILHLPSFSCLLAAPLVLHLGIVAAQARS